MNDKLLNTNKYPTTLIINAVNPLGVEIAESLLEQGGYVVMVDIINESNVSFLQERFQQNSLISLIDFSQLQFLEEDIRRLDYTFYLHHDYDQLDGGISSQHFLKESNYLDTVLALNVRFNAKFVLTTAIKSSYQNMADMQDPTALNKPNYTLASVQQYAESLTMEYVTKARLDGRVVRVGEMIGDGMDISQPTSFNRLVIEAASGQRLNIPGDGLESEYYVHVLDAAYGAVKALFTEETLGNIYNVAYEMPITFLSIAYRLQEIEPQAQELNFSKDLNHSKGFKLKNLAPNLVKLGWHPRIDLDQAISESLIVAKSAIYSGLLEPNGGPNVLNKLKSFLNIAQNAQEAPVEPQGGPVERLIAERNQSLNARAQAMDKSDEYLRQKRKQRQIPLGERMQNFMWARFKTLQSKFSVLSEITPSQFVMFLFFVVVFGWLYLNILSPALVLGRNMVIVREALHTLDGHLTNGDLAQVNTQASLIRKALEQNDWLLGRVANIATWVGADDAVIQAKDINEAYKDVLVGLDDVTYGSESLLRYLGDYTSNIRFRVSADSLLAVGNASRYEAELDGISQRSAYLNSGLDTLEDAKQSLARLERIRIPNADIQQEFTQMNAKLDKALASFIRLGSLAKLAPELLGADRQQTYLILVLDNARITPAGGRLASFIEITLEDGAVTAVKANSIENLVTEVDFPEYGTQVIRANKLESTEQIELIDLSFIDDKDTFFLAAQDVWQQNNGSNISGMAIITLPGLESLVNLNDEIVIEGESFTDVNLLAKINSLELSNSGRNELIAKITALTLDEMLQSMNTNTLQIIDKLDQISLSEDLIFIGPDLDFNKQIQQLALDGDRAELADSWIQTYLTNDVRTISDSYPGLEQSLQVNISSGGLLTHEMGVSFGSIPGLSAFIFCIPPGTSDIELVGVEVADYSVNRFANRTCVTTDITNRTSIVAKWNLSLVDGLQDEVYNVKLGIGKPTGVNLTTALEVRTSPGISITNVSPITTAVIDGAFGFREEISQDRIIDITLTE